MSEEEILEALKRIEHAIHKLTSETQIHLKAVAEAVLQTRRQ